MSQKRIQEGRQMVTNYEWKAMSRQMLGMILTLPSAVFIPMVGLYLIEKKKKSK